MKLALVGTGPWAQRYATTIGAMHDAELVAVVSRQPQQQRFGAVHWVRSLAELAAGTVDAVVVASSASSHAQVATEVLTQRLPVLIEKPMTLTGQAALQLHDLAKRQQQLLMVAHTHLYSEAFEALHARVATATQVVAVRSAGGNLGPFRQDCSALWDYGSHDVSMLFRLLGASVRQLNISQCQPAAGGINSAIRFAAGTSGEIPVEIEVGSGFSAKKRYLELTLADRDAAGRITERRVIYDDLATQKIYQIDSDDRIQTVPLLGTQMPLERTLNAFILAVNARQTDHWSASLGIEVCQFLERCEQQVTTH